MYHKHEHFEDQIAILSTQKCSQVTCRDNFQDSVSYDYKKRGVINALPDMLFSTTIRQSSGKEILVSM